jgi:3'-phosphoadenosine 5'-phosphosulfate sulfotransferase (PAPS reductase)/FAD synthetase
MRICAKCILPETFPGISFDDEGVCSHCRHAAAKLTRLEEEKRKYGAKFRELLDQLRQSEAHRQRTYDVLMAYSGGKDSTYTLALLKRTYGLRILAVSFDNGFLAGQAVENIRKVTDELGVDQVFFKPRWDLLKVIFSTAARRELYPRKTLERASTICTSCMAIVKTVCLKMALEQHIPMIGYGWSPGQAPVQSAIMRTNPALYRMTQQTVVGPLREVAGDGVLAYFLNEQHFSAPDNFPWNVHPLAWEHYDERMIIEEIGKLGWRAPQDTDSNSTNCLLNAFANEVHVKRYDFHPYVWEIANMVREGAMGREEGRRKFEQSVPDAWIAPVKEKLGL